MTETLAPPAPVAAPEPEPSLSIGQRIVAVFTRPSQAWGGLETRVQWWVPVLIFALVQVIGSTLLFERAMLPTIRDQFDEQVANGEMSAQQAERAEDLMSGPVGRSFLLIPTVVFPFVLILLTALGVMFGVGFLLGGTLRYRLALETVAWSSLINVVAALLLFVLAWTQESFRSVHIGFGAFLPEPETPNKLNTFLTSFLDGIGPFSIWSLVVMILGASTLSGKPRKPVALVLSVIYLVLVAFFSGLGALFSRGA
jgi:hypothetical protein